MKSFIPPVEVQANARRALEVRAQKPPSERGMIEEGLSRARDLSNGRALPLDTIKRMYSFFQRHEVDKQGSTWSTYGKGWQAWMGWGGDAGHRWVRRILARNSDFPSIVGSTKSGTGVKKADPVPGQPPAAPAAPAPAAAPAAPAAAPPAAPPPGTPPAAPGTPPAPPADPNAPPADPNAPPVDPNAPPPVQVEPMGEGKFKEVNSGKEFAVEQKVPKDDSRIKNLKDTEDYLESSGLKAAKDALANIAIMATESVDNETKRRLQAAGLVDMTEIGMHANPYGLRFLNIIDGNKDIASKEKELKAILYYAEQYSKRRGDAGENQHLLRAAGLDDTMQKSASFFNTAEMSLEDQWYLKDALGVVDTDDVVTILKAFIKPSGEDLNPDEISLFERIVKRMQKLKEDALGLGQSIDIPSFSKKLGNDIANILSSAMQSIYQPKIAKTVSDLGGTTSQMPRLFSREWSSYLVMRSQQIRDTTNEYLNRYIKNGANPSGIDIPFGVRRAEIIAVTEATNANALVAKTAQTVLNKSGIKTKLIWQTAVTEASCGVCVSLNGLAQGDGWTELPPLHPYCRCTVKVEREND